MARSGGGAGGDLAPLRGAQRRRLPRGAAAAARTRSTRGCIATARGTRPCAGAPSGSSASARSGAAIAAMLAPFGARLLVHDPFVPARDDPPGGGDARSWPQLLRRSRDLVLAAALTERTRGLLDRRAPWPACPTARPWSTWPAAALVDLAALTREVRCGPAALRARRDRPRGAAAAAASAAAGAGRDPHAPRRRRPARGPPGDRGDRPRRPRALLPRAGPSAIA